MYDLGITRHNINVFCSLQCPLIGKTRRSLKNNFFLQPGAWGLMHFYEKWPVDSFLLGITPHNIDIFCSLQCPLDEKIQKSPKKNFIFTCYSYDDG